MKLLGISGTITGSKTLAAVNKVLEQTKKLQPSLEIELLDLKQYNVDFCDGRHPNEYIGDTKRVIQMVEDADMYVIGTPIFQGSFTGALKNLFDLVPPLTFRHKVIGFVATGGTYQHYLVIENQLKPIAGYFRAFVAPGSVYLHNEHFDGVNCVVDEDALQRIDRLAEELILMQNLSRFATECTVAQKK